LTEFLSFVVEQHVFQPVIYRDHNITLAIGTSFLWIAILRFVKPTSGLYVLVLTLKRASARVFRLLLGAVPSFLAFLVIGTVMFGNVTNRFSSFVNTSCTLFGVLNGDEVRATIRALIRYYPVFGQIYAYTFLVFFGYVVLNVLIAIMVEAFQSTSETQQSSKLDVLDGNEEYFLLPGRALQPARQVNAPMFLALVRLKRVREISSITEEEVALLVDTADHLLQQGVDSVAAASQAVAVVTAHLMSSRQPKSDAKLRRWPSPTATRPSWRALLWRAQRRMTAPRTAPV
jgi:hypothetical protein